MKRCRGPHHNIETRWMREPGRRGANYIEGLEYRSKMARNRADSSSLTMKTAAATRPDG
jgi:hypothetical protein